MDKELKQKLKKQYYNFRYAKRDKFVFQTIPNTILMVGGVVAWIYIIIKIIK